MRRWIFISVLSLPLLIFGQQFPERPNRLVNDYSGTLSSSQIDRLEQKLVQYNNETSVQIAIVIMKTLDGYPIDDYAIQLGEKWGIGSGDSDNGALILVSMKEHNMWIATGYGLEATVTDALCKRIIENEMKPRFRKSDFAGGLEAASDAIIQASRGEYEGAGSGDNGEKSPAPVVGLVMGIIVLFWLVFWGIAAVEAKRYARLNGMSFWAAWALLNASRRSHGGSWSSFSGGSGGFGGGGGFGGFGGGSFGGGGAGGSW